MNAQRGKSTLLTLPARVEGRPLPPVRVVDLQEEREAQRGKGTPIGSKPEGPPVLTGPLIEAIEDRLRRGEDRKSTRLNSSHVAISYAVFCLQTKHQHI